MPPSTFRPIPMLLSAAFAVLCATAGPASGEEFLGSAAAAPDVSITAGEAPSSAPLVVETFAGGQTFRGTPNAGSGGDFGFYEGFLLSAPVSDTLGGSVIFHGGSAFAQSNLGGSALTPESRHQVFATVGASRRVETGINIGVVGDYLYDDWYVASSASQLRGETGWAFGGGRELGLWGSLGVSEDSSTEFITLYGMTFPARVRTRPIDLYGAFYRASLAEGGEARFFVGLTDSAQAVGRLDLRVPLSDRLSIDSGFTYLSPERDDRSIGGLTFGDLPAESWCFRAG
ncbi:MAG TPA: DUF6666 family protein, partial [Pirellulaceae bacterium]|nr:DUF6666 family protein [Pirellulaceae bacterium]